MWNTKPPYQRLGNPFDPFMDQDWFKNMDKEYWPIMAEEHRGPIEVVQWDLFDRITLPVTNPLDAGGRRHAYFFHHSMGTANYAEIDTSMQIAGTIPGNRTFVIASLGLVVPRKSRRAWELLAPWASCELRISAKIYRHMPAATIPIYNAGDPIYRKVTREMRTPGKAWTQVTVEETKAPLLTFLPHLVILPYRPFELVMVYTQDRAPLRYPLPIMAVLTGWDIRAQL